MRKVEAQTRNIIILGAGLAGLSAASILKKRGFNVTILEARERLGGRVWTQTIDERENLTVEMGGEWIGKDHKRMIALCKKFNLKLIDHQLPTNLIYQQQFYKHGTWNLSDKGKIVFENILFSWNTLTKEEKRKFDRIDFWHYLINNDLPKADINLLELQEMIHFGENIRYLSAQYVMDTIADDPNINYMTETDAHRVKGGNNQIIEGLVKEIGIEHIFLGHIATDIIQQKDSVDVICKNGTRWKGNKLICTLPTFSILQLNWDPLIPKDQYATFNTLNYSRTLKTSVLYTNRFWSEDKFEVMTDTLTHYIYHSTNGQKGTKGVLTSYATGDNGFVLSHYNEKQKVQEMNIALSVAFPTVEKKAEKVIDYYWGDDPYTMGGFAIFEKNQWNKAFQSKLKKPHEHVLFAGEHTADEQGYMEGALESGEKAAELC